MTEHWTCRHFSQANALGDGLDDVPALLRRVADSIESLGPVSIQDITFHSEITDEGDDRPTMTVYFHGDDINEDDPVGDAG